MYFSPKAITAFFAVISAPTAFSAHTSSISITYKCLDDNHITPNQIKKVKDTLISTSNRSYYPNRDVVGEISLVDPTITKASQGPLPDNIEKFGKDGAKSLPSGMWDGYQYEFEVMTSCACDLCGDVSSGEGCDCSRCMGHAAASVVGADKDFVVATKSLVSGGANTKSDYLLHWEKHFCGMMSIGGPPIDDCEITISPSSEDSSETVAEEGMKN